MKKSFIILVMLGLFVIGTDLLAGSIDSLSNNSAEYVRLLNRNGATDSADGAIYNPAGLTFLQDGIYANLSNQFIFKTFSMETDTDKFESTEPSYLVPNLFAVWSQGSLAIYATAGPVGGGGTVKYEDGIAFSPLINSAEMTSMFIGFTLGGSYAINDMISVALGGRLVKASKEIKADTAIGSGEVALDATGYTGIIGLNVRPMPALNIGLRYEIITKLEWDNSISGPAGPTFGAMAGYEDGKTSKSDLPPVLGCGITYKVTPDLTVGVDYQYYFLKSITIEDVNGNDENKYDNGWETGLSLAYNVMPALQVSAGYKYTKMGSNEETVNDFAINLDSNGFGFGVGYSIMPNFIVNVGFSYVIYKDQEEATGTVTYSRGAYDIAIGAQYRI